MAKQQTVVWRVTQTKDVWQSTDYSYAKVNGWRLEVYKGTKSWWFTAWRGDDAFNSAWPEVRKAWKSEQGAKAAAEKGALEGWAFLTKKEA